MVTHFVLDQNFPVQATGLPWPPDVRLSRLSAIDPRLIAGCDDWEVFYGLARRDGIDGFVTNDANILQQPAELLALSETSLTLIVTDGVGNDPIRATGLVMVSLVRIARQLRNGAQIYTLRPLELGKHHTTPGAALTKIAQHRKIPRQEVIAAARAILNRA